MRSFDFFFNKSNSSSFNSPQSSISEMHQLFSIQPFFDCSILTDDHCDLNFDKCSIIHFIEVYQFSSSYYITFVLKKFKFANCSVVSQILRVSLLLAENQPFPRNEWNLSKRFVGPKSQSDAENVPQRLQCISQDLVPSCRVSSVFESCK